MKYIKLFFIAFCILLSVQNVSAQRYTKNLIAVDSTLSGNGTVISPLSVNSDSLTFNTGYKSYVAFIKHNGGSDFTGTYIVHNDFITNPVLTHPSTGRIDITLTDQFTLNKTVMFLTSDYYNSSAFTVTGGLNNDDFIRVEVYENGGTLADLGAFFIEIRVYN